MRRSLQVAVIAVTAVVLVATSRAPEPCATETLAVIANTTCGPVASVELTTNAGCSVAAAGAAFGGLPTTGFIEGGVVDAGLLGGFQLSGATGDGGSMRCDVEAVTDGGTRFGIRCFPFCEAVTKTDGGPGVTILTENKCPQVECNGTLTPQ